MEPQTRRDFLADVGKGMLTASIGTGLASGLGLSTALAEESKTAALQFGRLEPLVELMQVNTAEQMLPLVVERLAHGAEMRDIVAAAALANARTFGGEDYIGFHAFMALAPAFAMTKEVPAERRALPGAAHSATVLHAQRPRALGANQLSEGGLASLRRRRSLHPT